MVTYYIISGIALFGVFVLFLVLSKTLNGIVNQLLKLEYMVQKELEFRQEEKEITRLLEQKTKEAAENKAK